MPWQTPTLREVRERVRDDITAMLPGSAVVGNTVLRIMADANAGLCHLTLRYVDWVALQLLPDTAEREWLDRHADIWLVNSDGTIGRKDPIYASGVVTLTGTAGVIVPVGTLMLGGGFQYETLEEIVVSPNPAEVPVRAIDAGAAGNLDGGTSVTVTSLINGLDSSGTVVFLDGGADAESDADLRIRVLERIQQPPMGGAAYDYVAWAKAVPGVTRAWAAAEQGPGTITTRFLMDVLRAGNNPPGWPLPDDVQTVHNYIDSKRPVTVMDCFVFAPLIQYLDIGIRELAKDDEATRNAIAASVEAMLFVRAAPGQTIYRSWVAEAVSEAIGEQHHELDFATTPMASLGHMAVLSTIQFTP